MLPDVPNVRAKVISPNVCFPWLGSSHSQGSHSCEGGHCVPLWTTCSLGLAVMLILGDRMFCKHAASYGKAWVQRCEHDESHV